MFHINNDGEVKECTARIKQCPFDKHFSTEEEGYLFLEQNNTMVPVLSTEDLLINNFVKNNRNLYNIEELLNSDNIYHRAKLLMYAKNALRFPYKSTIDDLTEEEIARIESKANSMNLQTSALMNVAISSPAGWAAVVMPNVEKQVYQETALFNFFKRRLKNYTVENLSGGGTNACYLVNGEIISNLKTRPKSYPKSLDMHVRTPQQNEVYIVAKYTMGEGGGQDNQYKDARIALEEMTDSSNVKIALILDGTYYTKRAKGSNKNRIEILQEEIIDQKGLQEKAFVGTYQEALNWIKQQ